MSDLHIIRANDVKDEIWRQAQQRQAAYAAWQASADRWEFSGRPTWPEIVQREPRLQAVEALARRAGTGSDDYRAWYREVKPRLERLVGHLADDQVPPLQTSAAYDVAYHHLLRVYEDAGE